MMQHVAEQDRVYCSVFNWKVLAVELTVVDSGFRCYLQIDPNHIRSDERREMVRYEAVAAADIQQARLARNHPRDFQSHVISASDLASPPLASPAALNSFQQTTLSFVQRIEEGPCPRSSRVVLIGRCRRRD